MKIFEVDSSMGMAPLPNPAQLSGLVQFLNGRANDTNAKKEISSILVPISKEDTDAVREQIQFVWDKIQARDFYTGCGKEDCHWCNFVKTNKLQVGFIEEEQEVLFD